MNCIRPISRLCLLALILETNFYNSLNITFRALIESLEFHQIFCTQFSFQYHEKILLYLFPLHVNILDQYKQNEYYDVQLHPKRL